MISLEQIRQLETKINKIIERIKALKEENQTLRKTLDSSQAKMQELEERVEKFKSDQDEIEQTILKAIKNLDSLEDELSEGREPSARSVKPESLKEEATVANTQHSAPRAQQAEQTKRAEHPEQDTGGNRELEIF